MSDERHSMQTYVSDMLALERHVRVPFETQAKDDDFLKYGDASGVVQRLLGVSQRHIDDLDRCLETLGGHAASPAKSAVSQIEGFFAGAIDQMRKTKVSKALRDDYTAVALCTAGYTMLETTALGLGDAEVAALAHRHLADYAQCVMDVGRVLPEVVLTELRDIGVAVDSTAAATAQQSAERAWRESGESAQRSATMESGTIEGSATGTSALR